MRKIIVVLFLVTAACGGRASEGEWTWKLMKNAGRREAVFIIGRRRRKASRLFSSAIPITLRT